MANRDVLGRAAAGRLGLGLRVRALRSAAGLTLVGLADLCGVSRAYLSDIERGNRLPALDVLDKVAAALGLSVVELLAGVYPWGAAEEPTGLGPPPDGRTSAGQAAVGPG